MDVQWVEAMHLWGGEQSAFKYGNAELVVEKRCGLKWQVRKAEIEYKDKVEHPYF